VARLFFVGAVSTAKRLQEASWLKIRVRIFDRQVGAAGQQKLAVKTAPTGPGGAAAFCGSGLDREKGFRKRRG